MDKTVMFGIVPLTPEQALERICKLEYDGEDQEGDHIDADDTLCGLLLHLGYRDIVEHYLAIPKWYA